MVIQIVALNSKHKTNRKQRKHRKATIISFPKEEVEKANLDKPVFNKIMTTREKRVIQFRSSFNLIVTRHEKCPYSDFSGVYFPAFGLNT